MLKLMSVSDVTIWHCKAEDRMQCRELWRELTEWHRHIYASPQIEGPRPEDAFDTLLAKVGADKIWVAIDESAVVGLVGLIVEKNKQRLSLLSSVTAIVAEE